MTGVVDSAVLVCYGLLLLSIGAYFGRRQGDSESYYLGGRTLSTGRVFGTTFSTFLGTGLLFTLAAFGFRFGVGAFVLPGAAVVGFLLLAWAAPRIRALGDEADAITLPGAMARYWSPRTRALAALVTAGLFTGTLAANLLVVGDLLEVFLGVSPPVGIGVTAAMVVAYTLVGGFRAVVRTDVAQLVLILLAFVLILPALVLHGEPMMDLGSLPPSHVDPFALPLPVLGAYLLVGVFAFFGSQDLFQRVFAARDASTARRGLLAFSGALAVIGSVAIGLGIVARALLPSVPPDRALLLLAETVTPAGLVGIVLLGFLALANSDADSQLLTVASNVTEDLLPRLGVEPDRSRQVSVDRLAVGGIGAGAALSALGVPDLTALFGALGSWFAILGFVVVATLFWDRTTDAGAFSGLAVGFVAPPAFVLATGNVQAATVVGLLPGAAVLGAVSLLTG